MNYKKYNCVRIDWKGQIEDTYYLFQTDWIDKKHILEDEDFVSLVENYDSEVPLEYLPALGQEFSTYNHCLYNIDEGSDHYCLVLIEQADREHFEKINKKEKVDFYILKQKRKKWGTAATRIKLSKRIAFEQQAIKGYFNSFNYSVSLLQKRTYTSKGAFKKSENYIIDTNEWPLKLFKTDPGYYLAASKNNDFYCINFENKEERKKEKHHGTIKISRTPFELTSWQAIENAEGIPVLAQPFWINEDLLILDKQIVWLVSSATNGNKICKKIFEVNNKRKFVHGEYPKVFNTLNGNTYILLYYNFYKWKNQKLIRTGLSASDHFASFNTFPTGNHRFVYIANSVLIEVDFRTKKIRKRSLNFIDDKTSIKTYGNGWAVLTRFGHTNKSLDIAQFWHPKTDTWIHMPLGKLGKYGIRNLFLHPDGYTLINTGDNLVVKVNDLLDQLKSDNKNIFSQPEWNENWKDEKHYNFWDKIKSLIN